MFNIITIKIEKNESLNNYNILYHYKMTDSQFDQLLLHTTDPSSLKIILEKYGVAVLDNYFDDIYADNVFNAVKKWLIDLNIGLTNDEQTWNSTNTPIGPKFGLYQSIISHCPTFWELREKIYPLFQIIYNNDKLWTSIDGASFYPGSKKPKNKQDWAHIDQTIASTFMCYQSQFVASDTSATFVATISSHLKHEEIVELADIKDKNSNWHKFSNSEVKQLKTIFQKNYQTQIHAKKSSVIFWDSRTIHSARFQDFNDKRWRAVFYVSMRPIESFTQHSKELIKKAAIEGRTTNHWASKIFDINDRSEQKNNELMHLMNNLHKLSYIDNMTDTQKKISALVDY